MTHAELKTIKFIQLLLECVCALTEWLIEWLSETSKELKALNIMIDWLTDLFYDFSTD